VSKEQVHRGDVLALPGTLIPTVLVDVHLRVLVDAPHEVRHNQPVEFYCGAAEVAAHTRLLDAEALVAGASGWVQLRLASPVAVQRGDHFILRQASPSRTIGGGTVVNPYPGRRWRRFRPEVLEALEALRSGDPARVLEQALRREEPTSYARLVATSGLPADAILPAFDQLRERDRLLVLDRDWRPDQIAAGQPAAGPSSLMSPEGWQALRQNLAALLSDYHRQFPLRQGMPREELKSRVQSRRKPWSLRLFNDVIAAAASAGILVDEGAVIRAADHNVHLSAAQQANMDQLLAAFAANPYAPPSTAESVAAVGEDVFLWLLDSGQLVKVSEDVVFSPLAYDAMVQRILGHLRTAGTITVAQVRDMFGTSRKYALALMEHLDAKRITRRVGDERVLRKSD
jgi:selenocysteine-specific elongation factor